MTPIVLEAPATVTLSEGQTERAARLLVVGEYPKKKLTVTEADLDALVANFSDPVPVKVEHMDTPLDPLGLVQRVWRDGAALMGQVTFPASMAAFLSERGAAKLSVGLLKEPIWKLLETSLTLTPHVPEATLLSDGERAELVELRGQVRAQSVEAQITRLKAQGRVIPATESLARVLLSADDGGALVTLSDGKSQSFSEAFHTFLQMQPPLVRLGEIATVLNAGASGAAGSEMEPEFSAEETELLRRLGVEPDDVKTTMRKDRMDMKKGENARG
jgi:hypothetical protein